MTSEYYYAIRIGRPKQHWPYFMLGPDNKTAALFLKRKDAKAKCPKGEAVVRVRLTEIQ